MYLRFPSNQNTPRILQTSGVWPFVGYENVQTQGQVGTIFAEIASGVTNPSAGLSEIARLWNLALEEE